jgi:hypothetical protein
MKILSLFLSAAVIALIFPACATTAKKDACCASDKSCPPSHCAPHSTSKKKGS